MQIIFPDTQINTISTEYEQDLINILSSTLGVDPNIISLEYSSSANDVVVNYSIEGDYNDKISEENFLDRYYLIMMAVNPTLYSL